jgi:hypothetical protein
VGRTSVPKLPRVRCGRRLLAASVLALAAMFVMPGMAAADPPFEPPIAEPPNLPPIAATFHVSPTAVPVGGQLTYQGFCGFPAVEVVLAIATEVDPSFEFVHFFSPNTTPMPGPFGVFKANVTIPATGNTPPGTPIPPGGYFAMASCVDADGVGTVLPPTFFEITAGRGRGGGGRG